MSAQKHTDENRNPIDASAADTPAGDRNFDDQAAAEAQAETENPIETLTETDHDPERGASSAHPS